jgi:hypothetical protein
MKILMRRTLFGLLINIAGCTISLFVLEWGAEGIALSSAISQWGMLLASMTLIRKVGVKINYAGHIFWLVTVTCYALAALSVTRSIHVYFEGATWLAIPESICLLALFALPVLTGRGHENQITRSLIARSIAKIKRP